MEKPKIGNPLQSIQLSDKLVYLLTNDFPFAAHVSQQIVHYGYAVQHIRDSKGLANIIADPKSVAVILDIGSKEPVHERQDIFEIINDLQNNANNLIFTADEDDQALRLKSIRAGGAAFFTKPINVVALLDRLDSFKKDNVSPQSSRVLIIEDQQAVASYYQMVLRMSGLEVQIATTPGFVLEQMREFRPDLILMNIYLSEISAADLAKVIRQIDDFVSIPIIFLSNEEDFSKRIEALELGGDDFLVKPIKASHLMAVVNSRLERSKTLRSYMVRDSLTNLLNHTAFRHVLTQEVHRCRRQNAIVALAMLDIDHFKGVNDTFGHATGDSALKGLSRLLKQRLRRSDIVGRYGGDEFVALLRDCDARQAKSIMDEIRTHFSEIEFCPNETRRLSLTFSGGISTFPEFQSPESLSDSADQALYIAKTGQRNQIVIATN